VCAAPGTEATLFQARSLPLEGPVPPFVPWNERELFLRPVDFGSQIPMAVELHAGRAPRARVLALLGTTEILSALPTGGDGERERRRAAHAFCEREWVELELSAAALEARPGSRWIELERPR
jgi:hypothetical protein